jgi:hypothetical protein
MKIYPDLHGSIFILLFLRKAYLPSVATMFHDEHRTACPKIGDNFIYDLFNDVSIALITQLL